MAVGGGPNILRSVTQGFRRMGLVLWKNLLLRKRQWVVMIFEIFLPQIISLFVLIGLSFLLPAGKTSLHPMQSFEDKVITHEDTKWRSCSNNFIAFAPADQETRDFMTKLLPNQLCKVDLNLGLVARNTENQLEEDYTSLWHSDGKFAGAVIFSDGALTKGNKISYKIRMPAECLPTTNHLYPVHRQSGYHAVGPNTNNIFIYTNMAHSHRCQSFLGLQWSLDQLLIARHKGPHFSKAAYVDVTLQPLPYPGYETPPKDSNAFPKMLGVYFMVALSSCFMIASVTRNVLAEKRSGISELLHLTGVPLWMQWVGWYVHIIGPQLPFILLMAIITTLVSGGNGHPMLGYSDTLLLFLIFLLFLLAKVSMGFLFCAIFRKPLVTTSLAVMVSFACIVSSIVIISAADSMTKQILAAFMPDLALLPIIMTGLFLELDIHDDSDTPFGITWTSISHELYKGREEKEPAILVYLLCLFGQFVVYLLVAAYMEGVLPSEHGIRRPWYFFNCSKGYRRFNYGQPPLPPSTPTANNPAVVAEEGQGDGEEAPPSESPPSKVEVEDEVENEKGTMAQHASNEAIIPLSSFEAEPVGARVGLEAINMFKRFGHKAAVNGVSLKLFTGDIFALLGHNGAGKTTLISMLTGFFEPSEGTAWVDGYDIRMDLDKARGSMGLCPQHNMLFEKLTTLEQLRLFGMLRGLTCKVAKAEAQMLLVRMSLVDKANVVASKLSGGQKRKLSLAIALIGGTRVVVLDEPTSGMDPQARREIWDLLLQLRGERTILLTTHFMEEADVLGDRIGIMAAGQLQCVGSTSFLKKFYGTGYTLKLTLMGGPVASAGKVSTPAPEDSPSTQETSAEGESSSQPPQQQLPFEPSPAATAILAAVQKFVPNASFKEDVRVNPNEVFINLPSDTATTQVLNQMFAGLTSQKAKLSIHTIGLSQTTMDEVFVRVGELAHPVDKAAHSALDESEVFQKSPKETKNRCVVQFLSLLMKKMLYMMHRWMSLLFAILLLLFMFLTAVHVSIHVLLPVQEMSRYEGGYPGRSSGTTKNSKLHRNLPLNLEQYTNPKTLYDGGEILKKVIGPSGVRVSDIPKELVDVYAKGREGRIAYKNEYVVAFEKDDEDLRAFYNLHPTHSAPVALNLASNYLLHLSGSEARIETSNHPFDGNAVWFDKHGNHHTKDNGRSAQEPENNARSASLRTSHECFMKRNVRNKAPTYLPMLVGSLIPIGLVIFLAFFVSQPIEEKVSQMKQLQTMTGVSPLVYWGATFLFDFALYTLVVICLLIWLVIFDVGVAEFNTFTANGGWFVFLVLCLTYGATAIPLCYLLGLRNNSVVGGYSLIVVFQLLGIFPFGALIPDRPHMINKGFESWFQYTLIFLHWLNRLNPSYAMSRSLWYYAEVSRRNSECPLMAVYPNACPKGRPYWVWGTKYVHYKGAEEATDCSGEEIDMENIIPSHLRDKVDFIYVPGVGQEFFFVIIWSFVYWAWILVVEYKLCRKLMSSSRKANLADFPPNINDQDVWDEGARVEELLGSGQVDSEALVVHQLSKSFGGFAAVNNLDFGVHFGECFGLLGVNGAGKTTAFRMITGDEMPTKGNVYGFGTSLDDNTNKFLSNLGYCPQFDAILEDFTGREMLELFAGLRGVSFKSRKSEALLWLKRMGLSESGDSPCGRYSGGMKRRLSTAMAVIGDPQLILLDEPTSGVDPVARRQFWKIIEKLKESGQSFILTSHSMEECEALCSRLGIMVNGQFQCFGGVQHLKSKFAQGYSLTLKLKPDLAFDTPEVDEKINELVNKIFEAFAPCEMKDKHQNLMQIHLQKPDISWDSLFNSMEEIKTEFELFIEDYSVNETSLEEVFLAFARMQYPERKKEMGPCMRCLTCRC